MGKKPVSRPMYEELEDTSWITGLRGIGDAGNQGILDNYNSVNVFDDITRADLEGRVNAIYNRTLNDFDRDYRETMNKTLARDYGRFGTTNATPALYNRDIYNLQQQRKLADLEYNRAATYDDFLNSELNRRYATMNMFKTMSDMGAIPYQQDVANWQVRNTNKDRQWMNDVDARNSKQSTIGNVVKFVPTAIGAVAGTILGGNTLAGAAIGSALGGAASNLVTGGQQTYGSPYWSSNDATSSLLNGLGEWYNATGQNSRGSNNSPTIWSNNASTFNGLSNYINNYINGGSTSSAVNSALNGYLGGNLGGSSSIFDSYWDTLGAGNNVT